MNLDNNNSKIIRLIGLVEGIKGLAALLVAFGFLSLVHHDLHRLVLELIGHFDLEPTAHYPQLLLNFADMLTQTRASSIIMLAIAYAAMRVSEGVGLWYGFAWGEWLAAISGGIYLPFELHHLIHSPSWEVMIVFVFNLAIVIYLIRRLKLRLKINGG
jgi:uncharacterized membrane protein (DUF2068 family)